MRVLPATWRRTGKSPRTAAFAFLLSHRNAL
jgi:hypothetical protein